MSDDDAIRGALALLVPPSADDAEWQDVLARADRHVETRRRRLYALVATGGLAIAVALALAVAPPWHGGPSLLDRAAAILSPTPGRVLFQDVTLRVKPLPADIRVAPTRPPLHQRDGKAAIEGRRAVKILLTASGGSREGRRTRRPSQITSRRACA